MGQKEGGGRVLAGPCGLGWVQGLASRKSSQKQVENGEPGGHPGTGLLSREEERVSLRIVLRKEEAACPRGQSWAGAGSIVLLKT